MQKKRGFTLIELLVVIAIITVLIALLLPAVQAAREAARRTQCKNNMKQLALGLHNYHDAHNAFPCGYVLFNSASWGTLMLPFIEQNPLYDRVDFRYAMITPTPTSQNLDQIDEPLTTFRCPSDNAVLITGSNEGLTPPASVHAIAALSNYLACAGSGSLLVGGNRAGVNDVEAGTTASAFDNTRTDFGGMFYGDSRSRMGDMSDGQINTALIGEHYSKTCGGGGPKSTAVLGIRTTAFGGPFTDGKEEQCHGYWALAQNGDASDVLFDMRHGINGSLGPSLTNGGRNAGNEGDVSSRHEAGAQIARGDASVKFVADTTDPSILNNFANRRDGQILGDF